MSQTNLLDYFACLDQKRRGERDPEGLCGREVEHQRELRGLLDWQVARLRPFQDLVDKDGSAPPHLEKIGAISHEASRLGIGSYPTGGGQTVRARKRQDTLAVRINHGAIHHHERSGPAASDRVEGLVECPRIAHLDALQPYP